MPRTPTSILRGSQAKKQQSRQLGMIALLGLVPLLLVYFVFTRHEVSAASTTQKSLITAKANLQSAQQLVASAAAGGKTAINTLEQNVKTAAALLPTSVNQQNILTSLPASTAAAGLTLGSLSAAGSSIAGPVSGLASVPVTVTVSGSFSGLTSWITTIQAATPLVTISNPSITASGKSSGTDQLTATLNYWYTTATISSSNS